VELEQLSLNKAYSGLWHIYEMEKWDEDYFNSESQAYLEILEDNLGDFQFGSISGSIDGQLEAIGSIERFSFTWQGYDRSESVHGSGWLQILNPDEVEGYFCIYYGEKSGFKALRVNEEE
jgi:hypothetical protein